MRTAISIRLTSASPIGGASVVFTLTKTVPQLLSIYEHNNKPPLVWKDNMGGFVTKG